jgi:hypothetical protein
MSRRRLTITGDGTLAREGRVAGGMNTNKFCKRLSVAVPPVLCLALPAGSPSAIHADTLTLPVAERSFQLAPREARAFESVTAGGESMPAFGKNLTAERTESLVKDDVRGFARRKWS